MMTLMTIPSANAAWQPRTLTFQADIIDLETINAYRKARGIILIPFHAIKHGQQIFFQVPKLDAENLNFASAQAMMEVDAILEGLLCH